MRRLGSGLVLGALLAALLTQAAATAEAAPQRLSVGANGEEADGDSWGPAFSADGRIVAFTSGATNLVANDTNGAADVFVVSRRGGELRRVSLGRNGAEANGGSGAAALSATEHRHEAAVLLAAADAAARATAVELEPLEQELHGNTTRRLGQALGAEAFAAARAEGEALGLEQAVDRGLSTA